MATHREPQWRVQLSGAPAEGVLGALGQGEAIVAWIADRAALALAAIQIGVAEEATQRTARYIVRAQAVRQGDRDVPGRRAARGRRLDRRRGAARRRDAGGLAGGRGPARQRGDRHREVVGRGRGLARGAHRAAPARRDRLGRRVPDPPLLPVVEAERAPVRRRAPAGRAARRAARAAKRTARRRERAGVRARRRCATTRSSSATRCPRSRCRSRPP